MPNSKKESDLSGTIPSQLGLLSNLTRIPLSNSQLSEYEPETLANVTNNDINTLGMPFRK